MTKKVRITGFFWDGIRFSFTELFKNSETKTEILNEIRLRIGTNATITEYEVLE